LGAVDGLKSALTRYVEEHMTDEQVHVPAGVAVAAVVLGLMAFVGLLLASFSAFVQFVMHNPLIPRILVVRLAAAGMDALILALVILAACTIVGLFRLRLWARYSIVLLGLLDFLVFGLMALGLAIARARWSMAALPLPNNPHITLGDILLALAAFYAVLALIGVWWMVYFNLKPVRLAFANAEARLTP
jgi:hypothetical protein